MAVPHIAVAAYAMQYSTSRKQHTLWQYRDVASIRSGGTGHRVAHSYKAELRVLGYAATSVLRDVRYCHSACCYLGLIRAWCLAYTPYAMCGTEVAGPGQFWEQKGFNPARWADRPGLLKRVGDPPYRVTRRLCDVRYWDRLGCTVRRSCAVPRYGMLLRIQYAACVTELAYAATLWYAMCGIEIGDVRYPDAYSHSVCCYG
eukprot:3940563-Rhodomonas_salina.3